MLKSVLTITFITSALIGSSQHYDDLACNKLIMKHFSKKDTSTLKEILIYFEKYVKIFSDSNTSIDICYVNYCEHLKNNSEQGSLILGFPYQEEFIFLNTLDERSFNKIWFFTRSYRLEKGIKVYYFPQTIDMSYKSPYMNLLRDIATQNPNLSYYYENYQRAGTMNSELINFVLTNYNEFNFTRTEERLMLAVHYLTVNSRSYK